MRPSDHSEPPRDQPIAKLIEGSLAAAQEHYATLSQARTKPHVLDDATLSRSEHVIGEDLEWIEVYERQLDRWQTLAPEQMKAAGESDTSRADSPAGERRYLQAAEAIRLAQIAQPYHDAEHRASVAPTTG
jgi:hypothetical protein